MKRPKFRDVKLPAPILSVVVTPYYEPEFGLAIHMNISMDLLEGILTSVAKESAKKVP